MVLCWIRWRLAFRIQHPKNDTILRMIRSSAEEFTPKRPCLHRPSGTTVEVSKDFLKKLGPSADRLNLTNNQLTCMVAAFTNHGGGKIDNIALSKSTTRRKRKVARREMAADVRRNFTCNPGQINFDGKLMVDLYGFGKVNRLAIVLVQEDSNKILAIVKTESSTGKVEAEAVKKALDEWEITEKIIACGFDTTSSNTGVRKGACTLLVVGAAFFELFGDTTSPEVTLFKDLQLPDVPSLYRADTEELLELAKLILGDLVQTTTLAGWRNPFISLKWSFSCTNSQSFTGRPRRR